MIHRLLFPVLFLVTILTARSAPAVPPVHHWSQGFGDWDYEKSYAVAADGWGNVVMTGGFSSTIDLGGGTLTSAGGLDIFVAKFDAMGALQWSRRFGSVGNDEGLGVAVDGAGNVVLTGYFNDKIDFGGGLLTSAGLDDIFVAKFDAAGVHQWSKRFGDSSNDRGQAVAIDGSGNVTLTGYFYSKVDFGGGALISAGSWDAFVVRFDAAGVHQWSLRQGWMNVDRGFGVTVDGSGAAIITGDFVYASDFGTGPFFGAGGYDLFVVKYDASGVLQWGQPFGGVQDDHGYALASDAAGNINVTGSFMSTVDFGGGPLVSAGGAGDIFVAQYDVAGTPQWSLSAGDAGEDDGYGIAVDPLGNVLVTGGFAGNINLGGGPLTSAGLQDLFLVKYDATGVHLWSQRFGGLGPEVGYGLAVDALGHVVTTGSFSNGTDLGGGAIVGGGGYEAFLASYFHEDPTPVLPGALALSLAQNVPNPFNPATTIAFSLAERGPVTLAVYDISGRRVRTLAQGVFSVGGHRATWDGLNASGVAVASGVYFYRLRTRTRILTRKMVLVK